MTLQADQDEQELVTEIDWLSLLQGKTIRGVRPTHENGAVPDVNVLFTDDTAFTVSVKPGVYFEGCLINTLRRAQPVVDVTVFSPEPGTYELEIRSRTFPLVIFRGVNKDNPVDEFPFVIVQREKFGG